MKKTMRFLSMAALALVGIMMTGCTNDDNFIDEPQQPANSDNVVTLTTTISLDGSAQTRALDAAGVKTFAEGETMALVYQNTSSETVKVVSAALTDGNITNEGKSATFTFELTNPDNSQAVTYIYPAAMANDDGTVKYDALATQNGSLNTLSSSLDLATKTAAWNGTSLPNATLENPLAILAMTLKNTGSSDITSDITGLTVSDGTNTYAVTREAAAGPIYVAIRPTSSANIEVTATTATTPYIKFLNNKTYAASNGYNLSLKMATIGDFLNKDGSFTATKQTSGANESYAVIAYVGSVANYFSRFLALALTDSNDGTCNWSTALTAVGDYAAAHPVTIGSTTYNTSTTGDTCYDQVANDQSASSATATAIQTGWRLPSVTDWRYVFDGLGRIKGGLNLSDGTNAVTPTSPLGVSDGMVYRDGNNGNTLRDAINTACGNTALRSSSYWFSSECTGESNRAWYYSFYQGKFCWYYKTNSMYVRAVFAY